MGRSVRTLFPREVLTALYSNVSAKRGYRSFFKVRSQLCVTSPQRNSTRWPDQLGVKVRLYV